MTDKDAAGNTSSATTATYSDTTPPPTPTASTTANPNGTLTVSGTGEPGTTVTVTFPDGTTVSVPVAANGTYAATSVAPQSSGTVSVLDKDAAGNTSSSATSTFVDTTAPLAPGAVPTANPNGTLTVTGTGEPGSTVQVTFPDGTTATVPVGANGTYSATSATPQGAGSVTAQATDAAGNASPTTTSNFADTTPPLAPTLTTSANPNGTITASGTAEPGTTVTVTFPDGSTVNALVAANGTYSATSATPQGSGSVTAIDKDAAGNLSSVTSGSYTDTTAPSAPISTTTANPNGTLTVSGTAEPGSTVKVTFPDGTSANVPVAANGTYSATSAAPQSSGTVTVTDKDAAGNISSATTLTYTDATAPTTPTLATAANPNGTLTVSGTAEPGSTVTVTFPDGTTAQVPVAANGIYSATSATPQGSGPVSVVDKDAAGNTSPVTTASFTDSTPPLAPSITTTANPNGTVTASGTAEPGTTVKVTFPDGSIVNAPVAANGTYSATSATPQTSGTVTATDKDAAGNTSPPTTANFVDTTAPAAPTVTATGNANGTLTVSGTGEPGTQAVVTFPDGTTATVPVAANGTYSATSAGPQSSGTVSVVDKDAAGNTSPATAAVYSDTTPPAAPTLATVPNANGTVTVSGTGEPGSTVTVTYPDGSSTSVIVAANGTYTTTSATPQPAGTISAVDKDVSGNSSPASTSGYTPPTPATPAISTVTDNVGAVQGNLAPGAATDDTTPTLSGLGTAGDTIKIYDGAALVGTAVVDNTGHWTATTSVLSNGAHTLNVTATSPAGAVSANASTTLSVDNQAPTAPVITHIVDDVAPVLGDVANNGVTNDANLVVQGTAEANATIQVFEGATLLGTTTADGTGAWTFNAPSLNDGAHQLSVKAVDAAGNTSAATQSNAFTIDTAAPTITATITSGTDDKPQITGAFVAGAKTNDAKPLYTGSLSAALGVGEVLSITVKDGANVSHTYRSDIDTAILAVIGTTFTLDLNGQTALADGAVTLNASVSDQAGNVGTLGNFAYTQDTAAPTAPAFTTSINGGGQGVLTGTAEPNAKIEVYLAGHTTPDFTTTADASGNWTYVAPLGTSTGGTVSAIAIDDAGNVSPANTQAAQFYIPFTPPAAVTTLSAATSYAEAGYSVSKIGDFNGDGIDDFVVGAPATEAGHVVANASHQYIVYGNANGIPSVSLDSLSASQGIKINNTTWTLPNSDFKVTGLTVTNLGDINGDGYADVGIASNANDRAYVLFGRGGNGTSAIELGSIDASNSGQATADGFVLVNSNTGLWWGSAMSGGDINGDGYGDIVVGSLDGGGNTQGQASVIYGHAGLGGTAAWQNLYASYDGMRYINAGGAVGSILNYTAAGTLNTTYNAGGGTFDGDADLGARVAVIADVNGDGFNDYIVTAPRADQAGVFDTGTAYLMFGSATGLAQFDLNNLTPSKGVRLIGSEYGEQLGGSYQNGVTTTQGISNLNSAFTAQQNPIANVGDINGDGIADFAIGSAGWGNQQLDSNGPGRVYVVYGKATGVNWAQLNLGALDGTNGFILNKASGGTSSNTNTSVNQLGWSVAGGTDLNGDGLDDLVVSAPGENVGGSKNAGAVYIVYGKSGGTTAFTSLNELDAMVAAGTAKKLTGAAAYQYFGSSVATADVNGDGIGDVIVGAAGVNTSAGATYITYGQTAGFTQIGSVGNDELLAGATSSGGAAIVGGVDRIDGGTGNDVIHGVGSASDTGNAGLFDVAYGAAGNDTIGIVGMNFTRVAGGQGLDTLKVEGAAPLSINLSALAVKVEGFESFDLSNTGSTITVSANDVLHQKSIVTSDFLIKGGANDHVTLTNGANAQWYDTGVTKTVNGVVYEIYHSTAFTADNKNADVLVQQGMQVDLTSAAQVMQTAVATKQYAYSGYEVANVGDFNGDGITDYVVSAPANEAGHEQAYGSKQYVVYGTANGVPQVNLDNLTAAQGIALSTTNMKFGSIDIGTTGSGVSAVGDINGDGFADFAMSSDRGDSAFVIFGRGGNATNAIDLATVSASNNGNATADGFLIANFNTGGWMGTGVSGGDINGDGYGDLIVGSSDGGGNGNGQYMVLYGHAGAGGTAAWQNLYAAADGLHNVGNLGAFGTLLPTTAAQSTNTTDNSTGNFAIDGDLGDRIAVVGDVNGDGFNDYIVTSPRADRNSVADTGTAYLMFGSAAGLGNFDLKNMTASQGVKLFGSELGESLGGTTAATVTVGGVTSQANVSFGQSHSVANIGDINGDGIDDFAIGSPGWGNQGFYDAGPGRTYVVYGQTGGATWSDASLGSLNGTTGFILNKSSAGTSSPLNTNNNQLGWSIAGGGDFNGDGIDDMVVSAVGENVAGNVAAGAAYVVFGQAGANATSTFTSSTDLDALVTANKAVKFTGSAANDHFGASVTMGDFNGDGLADVMVGAPGSSAGGVDAGQTYIYYGSQANLTQAATLAGDTLAAGGQSAGYASVVGGVDRISGGIGNDTITGLGSTSDTGNNGTFDTAYGGAGNDRVEIVGMNFTRVDGGLGNDTLALTGANLSLNLSTVGDKVQSFENFALGNQNNTLTLRLADVVQMSESMTGSTHVSVSGGATDTLDLVGATWANTGTTSVINGNTYDLWSSSLLPAANHKDDVWVQQGVVVV